MRTAFINALIEQARVRSDVFLLVGDLGYSVVEPFAEEFPDRFLNAGVAEQNMTGMAAGLASEGYHVFTYSIANFPTTRCLEQIRNDVCYHGLPVTVVAVGGGLAYGSLGYSHHAVQDYSMMRGLPGMKVVAPGDPYETTACVDWVCRNRRPTYLRLGKAGEPRFHNKLPEVSEGDITIVREAQACEGLLLTTGSALATAVSAAGELEKLGHHWAVATMPIWSEACKAIVSERLGRYSMIICMEDHLIAGGFGSYLREVMGNDPGLQARLKTLALGEWVCGEVGSQRVLNRLGGLSEEAVIRLVTE